MKLVKFKSSSSRGSFVSRQREAKAFSWFLEELKIFPPLFHEKLWLTFNRILLISKVNESLVLCLRFLSEDCPLSE